VLRPRYRLPHGKLHSAQPGKTAWPVAWRGVQWTNRPTVTTPSRCPWLADAHADHPPQARFAPHRRGGRRPALPGHTRRAAQRDQLRQGADCHGFPSCRTGRRTLAARTVASGRNAVFREPAASMRQRPAVKRLQEPAHHSEAEKERRSSGSLPLRPDAVLARRLLRPGGTSPPGASRCLRPVADKAAGSSIMRYFRQRAWRSGDG